MPVATDAMGAVTTAANPSRAAEAVVAPATTRPPMAHRGAVVLV